MMVKMIFTKMTMKIGVNQKIRSWKSFKGCNDTKLKTLGVSLEAKELLLSVF